MRFTWLAPHHLVGTAFTRWTWSYLVGAAFSYKKGGASSIELPPPLCSSYSGPTWIKVIFIVKVIVVLGG